MDSLESKIQQNTRSWRLTDLSSARQDTEHEQVLVRLILSLGVVIYFHIIDVAHLIYWVAHLYLASSCALTVLVYLSDSPSEKRRIAALVIDVTAVTVGMVFSSEYTAPFYGGYLWLSIAYGLRYGHRYTVIATVLSVAGFSYALSVSTYWYENMYLGVGLLLWLILLPAYILQIVKRFEKATQAAELANTSKSRFVSGISHELRTPLNAILGYSDLLQEEALDRNDNQAISDLGKIRQSADHLLELVNDLLDISKIEAGKMQLQYELVDLKTLLDEVEHTLKPLMDKNGNQLQIDLFDDAGNIVTDYLKLKQIIINLLSNAAKFTHNGEVNVWVTNINKSSGRWLKIVIKDSGVGMSAEQMKNLFQPYTQAEVNMALDEKGTGLGLSLCKKFTELLGGSIELYSEPGRGSTFIVLIPYS